MSPGDDDWDDVLAMPVEKRIIRAHQDCWFDIPQSLAIIEEVELLFKLPKKHRPHSILLIAESGMGKSMIFREIVRRYPAQRNTQTGDINSPVVSTEMPSPVDVGLLLRQILYDAGCPCRVKSISDLKAIFIRKFDRLFVQLLLVDEVQRVGLEHRYTALQVCETLKWVSTILKVPIIAAGTPNVLEYFEQDSQLASRFKVRRLLHWKAGKEFQELVCSILTAMPLRQGFDARIYSEPASVMALHAVSHGTTDGLFYHIRHLTTTALRKGQEFLNVDDIVSGGMS